MRSITSKPIRPHVNKRLQQTGKSLALLLALVSISNSGCLSGQSSIRGNIPASSIWASTQNPNNETPWVNVEMPPSEGQPARQDLNHDTTTLTPNSDRQGVPSSQPATGFIPSSNPYSQQSYPRSSGQFGNSNTSQTFFRGQSGQDDETRQDNQVQKVSYQYPEPVNGVGNMPDDFGISYADIDVYVSETQTGKINFGGAYNSDNGIVGQFVIDERNFDIRRFPKNFGELFDGTAWRGAGQGFRLELVPGRIVKRYLVSFTEPYLFNTRISFSASAYLFDRRYFDWNEQRLGARFALGYRLDHDISVSAGLRAENVDIRDPRVGTSAQLNASLGETDMYIGHVGLIRDTRDHPYMATEGTYLSATYSIGFGENDFARGDIEYRRYLLMHERPDGSGRHTVSMSTRLGFTGSQTPIFENYFAGGFSTMRGFDFRGASPIEGGVRVGGEFQWLNTVEYTFPLTSSDMIKGVLFCDFGTIEQNVEINSENFRVAPGFGFRVHMPAAGIGAPLAFDFAFPISSADADEEKMFSFYLGVLR